VHRFRKRFREVYRDEVSQTLPGQADVEAEVRYLADILARG
jgi:RNA polymerase sigma-70 factor (ECF subfamily)